MCKLICSTNGSYAHQAFHVTKHTASVKIDWKAAKRPLPRFPPPAFSLPAKVASPWYFGTLIKATGSVIATAHRRVQSQPLLPRGGALNRILLPFPLSRWGFFRTPAKVALPGCFCSICRAAGLVIATARRRVQSRGWSGRYMIICNRSYCVVLRSHLFCMCNGVRGLQLLTCGCSSCRSHLKGRRNAV